jgi:hypothetical protein
MRRQQLVEPLEDDMRLGAVLIAVLTIAIVLIALLGHQSTPDNRGPSHHLGHPVSDIGKIFRGH